MPLAPEMWFSLARPCLRFHLRVANFALLRGRRLACAGKTNRVQFEAIGSLAKLSSTPLRRPPWLKRRKPTSPWRCSSAPGGMGIAILTGADQWVEARVLGRLPDAWVNLGVDI